MDFKTSPFSGIGSVTRGGSRGRVQGVRNPLLAWDDLRFSNTTGILQKKMWFIGFEVEQEMHLLLKKKNPGSAPSDWA